MRSPSAAVWPPAPLWSAARAGLYLWSPARRRPLASAAGWPDALSRGIRCPGCCSLSSRTEPAASTSDTPGQRHKDEQLFFWSPDHILLNKSRTSSRLAQFGFKGLEGWSRSCISCRWAPCWPFPARTLWFGAAGCFCDETTQVRVAAVRSAAADGLGSVK